MQPCVKCFKLPVLATCSLQYCLQIGHPNTQLPSVTWPLQATSQGSFSTGESSSFGIKAFNVTATGAKIPLHTASHEQKKTDVFLKYLSMH